MLLWTHKILPLIWGFSLIFLFTCKPAIAEANQPELSHAMNARNLKNRTCTGRATGMELVALQHVDKQQEERERLKVIEKDNLVYEVCKPSGGSLTTKVIACLSRGLEAVMVADHDGVVCAPATLGKYYLIDIAKKSADASHVDHQNRNTLSDLCRNNQKENDKRLVPRSFIKDLYRTHGGDIDPNGLRVIGGVYCQGLDLVGLDAPFSVVLDKSVFTCVNSAECEQSPVNIRNFRTKGDLSLDFIDAYAPIMITRSDISGSFWGQIALMKSIEFSDSEIHGSLNLDKSFIIDQITVENTKVDGHVRFNKSFFSNLVLIRNRMGSALDIGETRTRCSYDIRQNEIDDVIAVDLGFGVMQSSSDSQKRAYSHKNDAITKANLDRFSYGVLSQKERLDITPRPCLISRSIVPGSYVFIGNHIGHSMCLRNFNWLKTTSDEFEDSIIYLNENQVGSATWLDLDGPEDFKPASKYPTGPQLNIFNHKTGTYVMDFERETQNITVSVNGLHFDRVYTANDDCEKALSPRASKDTRYSGEDDKRSFPPKLNLPKPTAVTKWVTKNSFKGTQPFAQFVHVFEQAGDADAARELRIQGETISVKRSLCKAWGAYCDQEVVKNAAPATVMAQSVDDSPATLMQLIKGRLFAVMQRIEEGFVALIKYTIWFLADHGYRPERTVWFVIGTVVLYWIIVKYLLGIIGFSVIDDATDLTSRVVRPLNMIFLFDKLIPAYQLRADHSKPMLFYVRADGGHENTKLIKGFLSDHEVMEATPEQQRRMLLCLDTLRWLGLIFAIFLFAAIGRLVR